MIRLALILALLPGVASAADWSHALQTCLAALETGEPKQPGAVLREVDVSATGVKVTGTAAGYEIEFSERAKSPQDKSFACSVKASGLTKGDVVKATKTLERVAKQVGFRHDGPKGAMLLMSRCGPGGIYNLMGPLGAGSNHSVMMMRDTKVPPNRCEAS